MQFKSKGEKLLYEAIISQLKKLPNLKVIREYKLNKIGCPRNLSIDFMIVNQWEQPLLAIECQGLQHYKNTDVIDRDEFKQEWLFNNFIKYLPIPWYNDTLWFNEAFPDESYYHYKPELAEEELFASLLERYNEIAKEKITLTLEERKKNREAWAEKIAEAFKEFYGLSNN